MLQIHAKQIKAARAYLDWSQEDLARAAGLAVSTIRNLETGYIPRGRTAENIRQAIEKAGLEFIEPEGFRRRTDEISILQGPDSREALFEDMLAAVKKRGCDIVAIMKSQNMLIQACAGSSSEQNNLMLLSNHADVLCLLPDAESRCPLCPPIQFRTVRKEILGPVSYFLYGNKHVLVLQEGEDSFRFAVFNSSQIAQSYRAHFLALWEIAAPLNAAIVGAHRVFV